MSRDGLAEFEWHILRVCFRFKASMGEAAVARTSRCCTQMRQVEYDLSMISAREGSQGRDPFPHPDSICIDLTNRNIAPL